MFNPTNTIVRAMIGTGVGSVMMATGGTLCAMAIGFSSVGPVGGTLAASWMSNVAITNGIGVTAGSIYATLQSMAMTNSITSTCGIIGGVVGAVVSLIPNFA